MHLSGHDADHKRPKAERPEPPAGTSEAAGNMVHHMEEKKPASTRVRLETSSGLSTAWVSRIVPTRGSPSACLCLAARSREPVVEFPAHRTIVPTIRSYQLLSHISLVRDIVREAQWLAYGLALPE